MSWYAGHPLTQFDGGPYANQNCTPTAGAMAADQATGGRIRRTGSTMRALIPRSQEQNPATPGWSIVDLDTAMAKLGIPFTTAYGHTWTELVTLHVAGHGIVMSGDSDQFTSGCSAAFDGDHATYLPAAPADAEGLWRLGDPICHDPARWTYQSPSAIRRYMEKFGRRLFGTTNPQKISFGYTAVVPQLEEDNPMLPITDATPHTLDIAPGKQLYDLNGTPLVKVSVAQPDIYSPFTSGVYYAVRVVTAGIPQLLLVKRVDATDVRPYSGFSQGDVEIAVAANEAKWERWVATHP